ncbi:MAG: type VI secretion system ImpA family N-terminal domain-containing protein [Pirellulaceae bacterium]|nr:type VI secretion system ImpA family N-terminal domain-containing protein [Pirellulaceae bacterium]
MSQPALLDFDALAAPISQEHPWGTPFESGEDTSLSLAFNELRPLTPIARRIEAKRFELSGMGPRDRQEALTHSEGQSDGPQADPKWKRIAELSIDILTKYSKDTRVMVTLIESMMRLHGLPGLRDAFKACSMLLDRFKLDLYPAPDKDENGKIIGDAHYCLVFIGRICESELNNVKAAIYQAEIFEDYPGLSWLSHISASNLEKLPSEEREEAVQSGELTLNAFALALNDITEASKLTDFDTQITEALSEAKQFDSLLTVHSNTQVGINGILDGLTKLQRWYRGFVEDRLKTLAPLEETGADAPEGTAAATTGGASPLSGVIANREQALSGLLQVASFFRKTEPHSPISYALEQAVRWGKMPLPDLLRDLVADNKVLSEVYRRMGILEKEENSDSKK